MNTSVLKHSVSLTTHLLLLSPCPPDDLPEDEGEGVDVGLLVGLKNTGVRAAGVLEGRGGASFAAAGLLQLVDRVE